MNVVSLERWPLAIRYLLSAAQDLADARGHEATSPAHVNAVLFDMLPVREAVGARITESAIGVALMVEKKHAGRNPSLTKGLFDALGAPETATTVEFLRRYATGHPTAAKTGLVIAAYAEPIAAALEAPGFTELMELAKPDEIAKTCPFFSLAIRAAAMRKHREVETRHVVLVAMEAASRVLVKKQLGDLAAPIAALEDLIARSGRKNEGNPAAVRISPRLAGVLASAVAAGGNELRTGLHLACARGDEALGSTIDAYNEAMQRLADAGAAPPT